MKRYDFISQINRLKKLFSLLGKAIPSSSVQWQTELERQPESQTLLGIWYLVPSQGISTILHLKPGTFPNALDISQHQKMLKKLALSIQKSSNGGPKDDGAQLSQGIITTVNTQLTVGWSMS